MSEYTSNLQLFKYDTATDGKEVFSINASMNDNWDKIDAFAAGIKSLSNLDEQGEKRFTDINAELNKKLEADVLLAENGYIKFNSLHFCLCWGAFMGGNYVEITMPVSFADTKYALFSAWNNGTLIDDNINAWRLSVNRFASNRSWNGAHDGGISVYMNYCAMGRIN